MTLVMDAVADGALDAAVAQAKAWLRIDSGGEDGLIERLVRSALEHAEAFLGQIVLARDGVAVMPVSSAWTRLPVAPVRSIGALRGLPAEGAAFALAVGGYAIDIDAHGDGWVRVTQPGSAGRVEAPLRAGIADNWDDVPAPVGQAIVRLAAHMFTDRDGERAPPASVTALLRPWRRMTLAGVAP